MIKPFLYLFGIVVMLASCTVSKIYPKQYYEQHRDLLHATEGLYHTAAQRNAIAIAFNDLSFTEVSLELKTDTVRYIYDFQFSEARLNDTLVRYGYDTSAVRQIIANMRSMRSTWINTLDHYIDGKKQRLLFISAPVKQFSLFPLLQKRKYYLFNFYSQPQYYDDEGRLLDKRKLRRLRKVNNETFWRINSKVCYTVSGKFR